MCSIIKCKKEKKGVHSFYINYNGKDYYLFTQDYHKGVNNYFSRGVSLDKALNCRTANGDFRVMKTMEKLKPYIKYIEKEYNIKILKNTINRRLVNKTKKHYNIGYYSCLEDVDLC